MVVYTQEYLLSYLRSFSLYFSIFTLYISLVNSIFTTNSTTISPLTKVSICLRRAREVLVIISFPIMISQQQSKANTS